MEKLIILIFFISFSSLGQVKNTKKLSLGGQSIKVLSDEEIDNLSSKSIYKTTVKAANAYFKAYKQTIMLVKKSRANQIPYIVFIDVKKSILALPEEEIRRRYKDFFKEGGMARTNKWFYKLFSKRVDQYHMEVYGKTFRLNKNPIHDPAKLKKVRVDILKKINKKPKELQRAALGEVTVVSFVSSLSTKQIFFIILFSLFLFAFIIDKMRNR